MIKQALAGQKIAVIVENKFIPEEIAAYQSCFPLLGAEVEFISRIWYGNFKPGSVVFYSDVDPTDNQPWESPHTLAVTRDVSQARLEDYAAVIVSANYTSVRLRWEEMPEPLRDPRGYVKTPPLVRFFAEAMMNHRIIKGALCHGLWILTPNPDLLRGRTVTCHAVIMADVLNCGAEVTVPKSRIVVDRDLVTGFSKHEVVPFIRAIAEQIAALSVRAAGGTEVA